MLILLFHVGEDLYAIESSRVVEIIPKVPLRKIHHVPDYVVGIFNYRGTIVPVIDLCHLIQGAPSRHYLSTRIMMVNYENAERKSQYLGLIAERITKTLNKKPSDLIDNQMGLQNAPYLGGMIMDDQGIIQQIHLERLFTSVQSTYLLIAGKENEHESRSN